MLCYIKVACDYNGKTIIQYCMLLSSGISFYEFWMVFHVSVYSSSFFLTFDNKSLFYLSLFHSHFRSTLWKHYITNIDISIRYKIFASTNRKWSFDYYFRSVWSDFYWKHFIWMEHSIQNWNFVWFMIYCVALSIKTIEKSLLEWYSFKFYGWIWEV